MPILAESSAVSSFWPTPAAVSSAAMMMLPCGSGSSCFVGRSAREVTPTVSAMTAALANQVLLGGAIEGATLLCTNNLFKRLNSLNIPATFDFRPNGTHSWGYWEDDLHKSWPWIARTIGL